MARGITRAVRRIEDGLDGLNDANRWGGQASRRIVEGADEVRDLRRLRLPDNAAGGLKYGDEVADARQARRLDDVANAGPTICITRRCLRGHMSVLNGEGLGPIKEVRVGNRLISTEESYLGDTAVDEATWKVVQIGMPGSENAGALELELLRSPEWMAAMGAAVGQEIWLEVPEASIAGFGVVEAIEPCPAVEDGPGRVVLATIRVWSEDVVQVWLKGLDAPLEATADHPVYSVTRKAWVGAGELLAGEEIWALGDMALVLEVDSKRGAYSVFNLEVEGEHVFFVSDLRVLSHNVSSRCPTNVPRGGALAQFDALARRAQVSDEFLTNKVLRVHGPESSIPGKSRFLEGFDIRAGIRTTLDSADSLILPNTQGRPGAIFIREFGETIGTNARGNPVTRFKVVLGEHGHLITAFPIR